MAIKPISVGMLLLLASSGVQSADIAREVSESGSSTDNFLEVGLSIGTFTLPLLGLNDQNPMDSGESINGFDLAVEGQFEYKNIFLEFFTDSFNDVTLGYSAFSTERYSVDLILNDLFGSVERNGIGFESIEERDADLNFGVRGGWYSGDNLLQLELLRDVSGAHHGINGSAQLGRQFQIRNWSLHALAGLRFFSGNVLDHYFGISEQEATTNLPAYRADDGFMPSLLLGATLPLNEKWLFRASAGYSRLPESVQDSPLAQGDEIHFVRMGFHRVVYPW